MLGSPRLHIVKVNDFLEGIGEGGGGSSPCRGRRIKGYMIRRYVFYYVRNQKWSRMTRVGGKTNG